MPASRRLKIALIGLGRLGAIRARILAFQQPRIEFVAACDTKPGAAEWAAEHLPASVKFYADPEDCLRNSGVEAVLISTATATHAPLILLGLNLGLVGHPSSWKALSDRNQHVMCEKPISTEVLATQEVIEKAKSRPDLKFLVPFSRRCKPHSYTPTESHD
jgi:myo-inositol 2-dehydrogenase / D-chiro-inositol 1-dehydrogenase